MRCHQGLLKSSGLWARETFYLSLDKRMDEPHWRKPVEIPRGVSLIDLSARSTRRLARFARADAQLIGMTWNGGRIVQPRKMADWRYPSINLKAVPGLLMRRLAQWRVGVWNEWAGRRVPRQNTEFVDDELVKEWKRRRSMFVRLGSANK